MKVSNCLKLVLLCGCPPDNSNFQLQLRSLDSLREEAFEPPNNHHTIVNSLSDTRGSRSNDLLNLRDRIIKKCFYDRESSDMSFTDIPEISYQDEQKAIALILEYLKMKYSEQPKFPTFHHNSFSNSYTGGTDVNYREESFKKSQSAMIDRGAHRFTPEARRQRGRSLVSNLSQIKSTNTNKLYRGFSFDKRSNDADLEKSIIKSPKTKAPFHFFKRLANQTILNSKTIVETNDLEIKEVLVSNKKIMERNRERPNRIISSENRFMGSNKIQNNSVPHMSENTHDLSPDTCIVVNPNIIDEVAPYVLRFVKTYLGDFRRYLLDSYIGVDSISVDYFDSMVDVLEKFPIDDLTLFKNLKYTLATLFPPDDDSLDKKNVKVDKNLRKYEEKLPRKRLIEPTSYKYTIRSKNPINFDESMRKVPSFIVRYYPVGNKLHRNSGVQTEESTIKSDNTFKRSYYSRSKEVF